METVYILQIVTISVAVVTLLINVFITLTTAKQKNYNEIITTSRLEFMKSNRDNAAAFIAEAKNIAFLLRGKNKQIDLKPLYGAHAQICLALKEYNDIDKEITMLADRVLSLTEQAVLENKFNENISAAIEQFERIINIYDDADWQFIKQQFNSTSKNSADFDKICEQIKAKYKS
ncbi:MAG: hypothetical protein J1F69_03570 [Clostridiales bacterium]|nr:hypothetical protein [Clostridiales bacterium]